MPHHQRLLDLFDDFFAKAMQTRFLLGRAQNQNKREMLMNNLHVLDELMKTVLMLLATGVSSNEN